MSGDFDINAHLQNMRFGQQQTGSSDSSGGADTAEMLLQKGIDKSIQTAVKTLGAPLGININTDIEGKSAMAGFDPQSAMSGGQTSNAALIKPESGGGWLSMMWDTVKKYLTRDLPSAVAAPIDAGGSATGGGGGGDGGGFADSGGSATMGAAGGGDFHNHMPGGGGEMPEAPQVNYGGKMVAAESLLSDLGNLRPDPTPAARGSERDTGGVAV